MFGDTGEAVVRFCEYPGCNDRAQWYYKYCDMHMKKTGEELAHKLATDFCDKLGSELKRAMERRGWDV